MKHPNIEFISKTLLDILSKKRLADWTLGSVQFQYFPSRYLVTFSNKETSKVVSIISDYFDDIEQGNKHAPMMKIKRVIKDELLGSGTEN